LTAKRTLRRRWRGACCCRRSCPTATASCGPQTRGRRRAASHPGCLRSSGMHPTAAACFCGSEVRAMGSAAREGQRRRHGLWQGSSRGVVCDWRAATCGALPGGFRLIGSRTPTGCTRMVARDMLTCRRWAPGTWSVCSSTARRRCSRSRWRRSRTRASSAPATPGPWRWAPRQRSLPCRTLLALRALAPPALSCTAAVPRRTVRGARRALRPLGLR